MPELYTDEALDFLVSDPKRLDLGDNEQYDTRQLVKALVPHLNDEQVSRLEAAFLSYFPIRKYAGVAGLRWRGLEQLYLLQCIPAGRLTERGVRRLRELERVPRRAGFRKPKHYTRRRCRAADPKRCRQEALGQGLDARDGQV